MLLQSSAGPQKAHLYPALCQSILSGELLYGSEIPVSPDKKLSAFLLFRLQKAVQTGRKTESFREFVRISDRGSKIGNLFQHHRDFTAAPLFRSGLLPAVEGEISCDFPEKAPEHGGAVRRDAVPASKPGVIHTFLGVLPAEEDISRDGMAIAPVFPGTFRDRALLPLPV